MKIEDIFLAAENGALTLEQFQAAVEAGGGKFVDSSEPISVEYFLSLT